MIRKIILPAALLLILSLVAGCGGGAGTSSEPAGVDPSLPSSIQLLAVQQVVQTNSNISLMAKVLDGNGRVVPNVAVTFTNLSLLGVLSSTHAVTNSLGYATVTLFSSDSGFATIQAEVNKGTGKVRDRKIVFFSIFDLTSPIVVAPTLDLAVDNNNDNSYNDPADFDFFDPADPHSEAIIRATVKDETGRPVVGDTVTFGADSTEATFPDGDVKNTNSDGQAFARIKITPTEIRDFTVPLNVNAVSTFTGAANVITLFIGPITVSDLSVFADPQSIDSGGTSTITAIVKTVADTFVPDGTTVNFTTNKGGITPFAQTTGGVATATFTAPTLAAGGSNTTATITASVAGKSKTVTVTVIAPPAVPVTPGPLVVTPANIPVVSGATTQTVTFTVSGGTTPYFTSSSDPLRAFNGTSGHGTWNTSTVTVTIAADACPGTITLTTSDSTGATKTATITIVSPNPPLAIAPLSATICEIDNTCTAGAATADFTVSGGTPPYSETSSNTGVIPSLGTVLTTFTLDANNGSITADTTVTITVTDACSTSKTASVQVINQ